MALLLAGGCLTPASAADVPVLTGRFVDTAGIIRPDTRARITAVLKAHEEATTNQIAVLTVPTIQPESIEEYAVKVFASWKLGQKGRDNGVLLVVVPQDRKLRIEVGYGLEPVLTDGQCGQIIRNVITPQFKAGNYDKGIENGVQAIVAQLAGNGAIPGAPVAVRPQFRVRVDPGSLHGPNMPWQVRLLASVGLLVLLGTLALFPLFTPGMGVGMFLFMIPFWALFPFIIVGAAPTIVLLTIYIIGYPIAKIRLARSEVTRRPRKN